MSVILPGPRKNFEEGSGAGEGEVTTGSAGERSVVDTTRAATAYWLSDLTRLMTAVGLVLVVSIIVGIIGVSRYLTDQHEMARSVEAARAQGAPALPAADRPSADRAARGQLPGDVARGDHAPPPGDVARGDHARPPGDVATEVARIDHARPPRGMAPRLLAGPKPQAATKAARGQVAQSERQAPTAAAPLEYLDRAIVQRYINRVYERIRYCYEQRRLLEPGLAGTVRTQFLITASGTVSDSTASGLDGEVATCVASVIRSIEFPRSGGDIKIIYPFHFVPVDN